jgi:uncharacterized membrane protein (DUF106 family)
MKSYSELKSEMDNLEAQMEQAKKRERTEALKKVKQLCKGIWVHRRNVARRIGQGPQSHSQNLK